MKSIALVGNPNCGKSTLFNSMTGATAFVGNWPGVTVEKKAGKTKIGSETVQVIDLPGIYSLSPYSKEEIITRDYILEERPEVVVNLVDASNLERNLYLTTQIVELGVPTIVALNMMDIVAKKGEKISAAALSRELGCPVCEISAINNTGVQELKTLIGKAISGGGKAPAHSFSYSEDVQAAIDEIHSLYPTANEFLSLRILSDDHSIADAGKVPVNVWTRASALRSALEKKYDDDFDSVIAEQRYSWIKSIIHSVILQKRREVLSISDKIDRVLTHKILSLPIFFAIIYGIYWMCLNPNGLGKKLVGVTFGWVFDFLFFVQGAMTDANCWPWLTSLVCDGMIFGVGIVIAFVPYLMVLFFFLAILEECGYMSRVCFIFDRVFRRFGLSGKSFIPMLLGTGCTVQAVAAARTIEDENDRRMTIFLTPFMPCATMMPTVLLIMSLITDKAWIAPMAYILAICFIILGGIFLKNTMLKSEPAPFVMELPEYKIPRPKNIIHFVWERTVSFFRKAATIIFISTVIIWFLKYFNFALVHVEIGESMLASIGKFLSPIFAPLGFGQWELIAALITGFVAKDNFLSTLGQIYGLEITSVMLGGLLAPANAIGFLLFFILSSPCFASMGAMRKELGSASLTLKAIGFQMGTAYIVALIAYQVLHLVL